ncbi:MAG: HAMP domain-containing sensor histidine kinase [Evtepia sp.]|uniref:sensor histidine kinase n=1 Tax=Evtepia sp. TaxID=2773933 RepID=UPI002A75F01C|nr:HAMP domain-containing sensor histidine kinase [Evtepia sp.]MDY3014665.1 HAMP domain-containing sensor histidine kinase [Evtepia sp.]
MVSFLKVKGIRQRWLLNSVSILVMILLAVVIAFSVVIKNYYDSSILSDLENKARTAASYFGSYAGNYAKDGDYFTAAQDYVSSFDEGTRIELQVLTTSGVVIYSSNGLTLSGTVPGTEDITHLQAKQAISSWEGISPQTGERITAVSAPLSYNGELVGIMRYVTSMRLVDRQVFMLTLVAVSMSVVILVLVYISNIYFVRSIVGPVENITGIAQRIAAGSYGIQVEKKFDDEVGDLTDAINDMSMRIKHAESMKSEFISSVSHELRTPLTAITGWAETIMNGEARDEKDVRKGMGIIASEARRLSGMVEELLEFSRIEDGRFTLAIEPIDIKAELEDAVYTYHEFLAAEGIAVYHKDCEEEFEPIPGDPDRLRQVFCNLLDNAAKHGGAGKRIDTAIYPDGKDVVITVRDYGPGIPPEELPNVKYKFYKGSSTARGSGIGLAVCEEIVSRHNGQLIIRNAEDEAGGCLVEVRLPTGT